MAVDGISKGFGAVVLAFSQSKLPQEQWRQHVTNDLMPILQKTFDDQHPSDTADSIRYLDVENTLEAARMIEFLFPTQSQLSLSECSAACKSGQLENFQVEMAMQLVIQPTDLYALHRQPGLAVFDMDSTLIQQEVIDELARAVGLYSQVAAITEAAMRGEAPYTDFEASLRARVALLKGVPTSIWEQLKSSVITFTPGARELARTLKALGWKTAVLSGGFTPLATWVKKTLDLDYVHANHLVADAGLGILTGELVPGQPIIHATKKRELLLQIAAEVDVPVERTIAVGDGSNDLLMMGAAGLGIAFNAKPKVQKAAPVSLNSPSLLDVMHILGYSQSEVDHIVAKAPR